MPSVLVVTPDVKEAAGLLDGFIRRGIAATEITIGSLEAFAVPHMDALVAVGGNGKAQFAAQTQYLLDRRTDVRVLICTGVAGRLSDTLNIGDIIVGSRTVEHDYKNRMSPKPLPCHHPDPSLLKQFMDVAANRAFPFGVHCGCIASGDEDIVDTVRATELRTETDALCAAWEGSGGARAAELSNVAFLEIRCISDHADSDAGTAFQQNVRRVMDNVAELLIAWFHGGQGVGKQAFRA